MAALDLLLAHGYDDPSDLQYNDSQAFIENSGDMAGPYILLEKIGEGGVGVVWRAEQTEPVGREAAVKVIKAGMDSREIISCFEEERRVLALMNHPNIASVLDAGTTPGGRLWLAMELVRGEPVTGYCDRRVLGMRERLELFVPVCHAVQHSHQKGVLHRDLKPSNILVTEVDGKPTPKLIDFGIAKALSPAADGSASLLQHTSTGMVSGTPEYMSPEQKGGVQDVDTRSDIYSLGVVLYELLTGRTPLLQGKIKQTSPDGVPRPVRENTARRPNSCFTLATEETAAVAGVRGTPPRRLGRTLRRELEWIVLKALEKDRDRRYASAASLAADITRFLNNEPVTAAPPSKLYRLSKLLQRNRPACMAALCILTVLTAGTVISLLERREAVRQRDTAIAAQATADLALAQAAAALASEARAHEAAQAARDGFGGKDEAEVVLWVHAPAVARLVQIIVQQFSIGDRARDSSPTPVGTWSRRIDNPAPSLGVQGKPPCI
ncbi:MAG: serine/threonine protein kinase, partial [Verrucomicrobiaceae bacterium]